MTPLMTLRVPATSANLGSGFDSLGMALSLYNVFKVTELLPEGEYRIEAYGEGAGELSDPKMNLIVAAYEAACCRWGKKAPGLAMWCHNIIPLCRGLGSSAGAVVAGVLIAKHLTGCGAGEDELLSLMTSIEGHPDNVVPCFLGGMAVSCWDGAELRYIRLPALPKDVLCIVAVPEEKVRTAEAREALPKQVPFEDAVFNLGHAALLVASWASGKWDHLKWAMDDRLHQQYRSKLFRGGGAALSAVRGLPECLGTAISGSGPSILAFVRGPAQRVAETICGTFTEYGVSSRFFVLDGSAQGTRVDVGSGLRDAMAKAGYELQ